MKDKEIIECLKVEPGKGFRLLMDKYEQPLYWHIRRLIVSYDDSKDVAQETFVRIFRNIDKFDGKSFPAWLYRIATNEALRFLGKRSEEAGGLELAVNMTADSYTDYSDLEAVRLQKAILTLPPKQQAAFNMRYYDEMGYDEIAQAIDSTAAAAKMNYKLAKDRIIKYMTENE